MKIMNDEPNLIGAVRVHILEELRLEMQQAAHNDGGVCPVCDQFVKVYKRKITSTMARQLLALYKMRLSGEHWVHVSRLVLGGAGGGDFAKMEFWGLITQKSHQPGDEGKKTSGYWSITEKGQAFCEGQIKVPLHTYVYNGTVLKQSEEAVDIKQSLSDKFDYRELMDG